jgi:hypothetical protein
MGLDEEVEEKKERADAEKDRGAIDLTARDAFELAEKAIRQKDQSRFLAEAGRFCRNDMSDNLAAESAELVMEPDGNIAAVNPEKSGAGGKDKIAGKGKKPKS